MARPSGSPNRKKPGDPDYKKPGRKPGSSKLTEQMTDAQILTVKRKVLDLMEERVVDNLSQASEHTGVPKFKLYRWRAEDTLWSKQLAQIDQVIADELEEKLNHVTTVPQTTAIIFRLKKLRPEYRDNFKLEVVDSKMMDLLTELKRLAEQNKA